MSRICGESAGPISGTEKPQLIYVGLSAIARAVGAGPHTIKRWIREEAFPARRCSDGVYRASAQSMLDWFTPPFPGMTDSLTSRQWAMARGQQGGGADPGHMGHAGYAEKYAPGEYGLSLNTAETNQPEYTEGTQPSASCIQCRHSACTH